MNFAFAPPKRIKDGLDRWCVNNPVLIKIGPSYPSEPREDAVIDDEACDRDRTSCVE